jgi:hypothetical protein
MKRSEKFIKQSISVPFSTEDLRLLYKIVDNEMMDERGILNDDLFIIQDSLENEINGVGTGVDRESDSEEHAHYKELNFLQYLLVYFKKIYLFLMCVPDDKVPLYINNNQLRAFVLWRLQRMN